MAGSSPSFGRFSGVAAAASTAVVVGGRLGYRAYEDHRTAMARGTCVSAAADLDRAAKECRNLLGADATKSARPSSIIQIDRSLTAKAGRLGLKVPKLKGEVLRIRGHRAPQTARGKRRPAAISTGPGLDDKLAEAN